ncbi:MAG: hypothetical protein ACMUHB_04815 [Thermoplasmatota archaeon]
MIVFYVVGMVVSIFFLAFLIYLYFVFRRAGKRKSSVIEDGRKIELDTLDKEIFKLEKEKDYQGAEEKIDEIIKRFDIGWPDPRRYRYEDIRALLYRIRSESSGDPAGDMQEALQIYQRMLDHPLLLTKPHVRIELEATMEHTKLWLGEKRSGSSGSGGGP